MEELEKLYNVLSENKYYTKSYDEFLDQYQSADYRKKVYELASSEGLYAKDFSSFETKYSSQVKKKEEKEEPTRFSEGVLGDFLGGVLDRGIAQGRSVDEGIDLLMSGSSASDDDIKEYYESVLRSQEYKPSEGMINFQKEYKEKGGDFAAFASALWNNKSIAPQVLLESMVSMGTGATENVGLVASGGVAGGVAGAVGGLGVGAIPGSFLGAFSVAGGALEATSTLTELIQEELSSKELDFNPENIRKVLSDEKTFKSIRNKSIARGGIIGTIDLLTGGVAGKATSAIAKTGKVLSKTAAAGAGLAIEGLGGSLGEATARAAIGQEMDAAEIGLEGVAGLSTAPISIGVTLFSSPKYTINNKIVSRADAYDVIETMTDEQIASSDFSMEVKNDEFLANKIDERRKKAKIKIENSDIITDDVDLSLITEKQYELDKLKNPKTRTQKKKADQLQIEIDEITDKYIKKQPDQPSSEQETIDAEADLTEDAQAPQEAESIQQPESIQEEVLEQEEVVEQTEKPLKSSSTKDLREKDLRELYDALSQNDLYNKTFDEFISQYKATEKPFMARTERGKQSSLKVNFDSEGKIESVVNVKTGKQASAGSVREVEKQFLKNVFDVNQGKKAPEPQGLSERDIPRYVARESENVKEIVDAISFEKSQIADNKSMTQNMFDENGFANLKGFKFTSESWERMTGKTPKESKIDKLWIDDSINENTGKYNAGSIEDGWTSLLAREGELPNDVGSRVDVQDVIEFVVNNNTESKLNKFIGLSSQIQKTPELIELESKFTDLTGLQATPSNIEAVLSVDPERPPLEALKQAEKERLLSLKDAPVEDQPGAFGKKRGPSPEKLLGEERKTVEVDEAKALKDQIRLEARAAREAKADQTAIRKSINDKINDIEANGRITNKQAKAIVSKISKVNLNNNSAVDSALDYITKVFEDAEFSDKIKVAYKVNKSVSSNLGRGDFGINNSLGPVLRRVLNIPVESLSTENIDLYNSFLSKLSNRSRVIPLEEVNKLSQEANDLYNKIYTEPTQESAEAKESKSKRISKLKGKIDSEDVKIESIIDEFGDKILKDLDDIDSATLYSLIDKVNQSTSKDNAGLFKKLNDYAESRNNLINQAASTEANVRRIQNELRDFASIYNKIGKEDLVVLTGKQLEAVQVHIDNINNGFYTFAANDLARTIKSGKASRKIIPILSKFKKYTLGTLSGRVYGEVKSFATKRGGILETVRSNPLTVMDDVLGNYKGREISEGIFDVPTTGMASYEGDMMGLKSKVDQIESLLAPTAKESANKSVERKYAITYYLLQKEFESNPNKKGIVDPYEVVEATVEDYNSNPVKSIYNDKDLDILKSFEKYKGKTSSEILNSLGKKEKKAISLIQEVYQGLQDKALIASTIVRGEPIDIINDYVHHKVATNKDSQDLDLKDQTQNILNPSTRSKAAVSRTAGAKAIDFDPITTMMRSARYTLLDYNLTNELKVSNKTVKDIKSAIISNKNSTKEQIEAVNAVGSAYNEAVENILLNNFSSYDPFTIFLDKARTVGYQAMLASAPRAFAELSSNASFVILYAPKDFLKGISDFSSASLGQNGLNFVKNVKSKTITKLYGDEKVSSAKAETTGIVSKRTAERAKTKLGEVLEYPLRYAKGIQDVAIKINDFTVSSPDKAVSRPLFFGTFANEFKKLTGEDVNFQKISDNDVEYMSKFKEQIVESRKKADLSVQRASTTNSRFDVVLKNQINAEDKAAKQIYKSINGLLSRFHINEYATARQAIASALGSGEMGRGEGARLFAAVNARMASYLILVGAFTQGSLAALGVAEDEDEIKERAATALAGSAVSLMTRRTLGNVPTIAVNNIIEKYNEEYGGFLRDEKKYDKYKNSLVYNQFDIDELSRDPSKKVLTTLSGPYQAQIKSMLRIGELMIKRKNATTLKDVYKVDKKIFNKRTLVDGLGVLGVMPFYRDIRRYIISKEYSDKPKSER